MAAVVAELAKITEEHPYLPPGLRLYQKSPVSVFFFFGGGGGKIEWIGGSWHLVFFFLGGGNLWGSGFKLFPFSSFKTV